MSPKTEQETDEMDAGFFSLQFNNLHHYIL